MKKTKIEKHIEIPAKKTQKSKSLKLSESARHLDGKSSTKNPLGHLRSSLIEDENCLSRL